MKESLRPVTSRHTFAGLARPIACMDQAYIPPETYAKEIEALDSVQPGEVVVVSTGESECGRIMVSPGDLIVADYDGVVVVPSNVIPEAVRLAADKVSRESSTRADLLRGEYLRDVYAKYGVL
jgi:regulator of RNase E activity RraA